MPYKDKEKRLACRRKWYAKNTSSEKIHVQKRKNEIKRWFQKYKSSSRCIKCGENHPATIDFHHHSGKKEKNISKMVADGYSISRIEKELEKCIVLCSNCHRKEHFKNNKL
jgi:transcription elongation factor Elf1